MGHMMMGVSVLSLDTLTSSHIAKATLAINNTMYHTILDHSVQCYLQIFGLFSKT